MKYFFIFYNTVTQNTAKTVRQTQYGRARLQYGGSRFSFVLSKHVFTVVWMRATFHSTSMCVLS